MATLAKFFQLIGADIATVEAVTDPFSIIDIVPQGSANFESDKIHIVVEREEAGAITDAITLEFRVVEGGRVSKWAPVGEPIVLDALTLGHVVSEAISIPFNGQFRFKVSTQVATTDTTYNIAITF